MNRKIWLVALLAVAAFTGRAEIHGRELIRLVANEGAQSADDYLTESQRRRLYEMADRMKSEELAAEVLPEACQINPDSNRCLLLLIFKQLKARQAASKIRLSK